MSKSKSKSEFRLPDIRPVIRKMFLDQATTDQVAEALLKSEWNFLDPKGTMRKPPEEVQEFLENVADEVGLYSEMTSDGRKMLFKMICDAYCRALAATRE